MKVVLQVLTAVLTCSCSNLAYLNNKISQSQHDAILASPYKDAPNAHTYVGPQKNARTKIFKQFFKTAATIENLKDTFYLVESFNAICISCSSFSTQALIKDTVYNINQVVLGHKGGYSYILEKEAFKLGSNDVHFEDRNAELIEIVGKLRSGVQWKNNPLQYGIDNCADGSHTFITVVYPGQKVEALYVRCWLPEYNRKRK